MMYIRATKLTNTQLGRRPQLCSTALQHIQVCYGRSRGRQTQRRLKLCNLSTHCRSVCSLLPTQGTRLLKLATTLRNRLDHAWLMHGWNQLVADRRAPLSWLPCSQLMPQSTVADASAHSPRFHSRLACLGSAHSRSTLASALAVGPQIQELSVLNPWLSGLGTLRGSGLRSAHDVWTTIAPSAHGSYADGIDSPRCCSRLTAARLSHIWLRLIKAHQAAGSNTQHISDGWSKASWRIP